MYDRRFHVLLQRCQLHPLLSLSGRDTLRGGRGSDAAFGAKAFLFKDDEEDNEMTMASRKRLVGPGQRTPLSAGLSIYLSISRVQPQQETKIILCM